MAMASEVTKGLLSKVGGGCALIAAVNPGQAGSAAVVQDQALQALRERGEQVWGDRIDRQHVGAAEDAGVVDDRVHASETVHLIGNAVCLLAVGQVPDSGRAAVQEVACGHAPPCVASVDDDLMTVVLECTRGRSSEAVRGAGDQDARAMGLSVFHGLMGRAVARPISSQPIEHLQHERRSRLRDPLLPVPGNFDCSRPSPSVRLRVSFWSGSRAWNTRMSRTREDAKSRLGSAPFAGSRLAQELGQVDGVSHRLVAGIVGM
jgi:hypothetical protein